MRMLTTLRSHMHPKEYSDMTLLAECFVLAITCTINGARDNTRKRQARSIHRLFPNAAMSLAVTSLTCKSDLRECV